jgi:hypothetical protein
MLKNAAKPRLPNLSYTSKKLEVFRGIFKW